MPDTPSLPELEAKLADIDGKLAELTSEGYSKHVEQFGEDLGAVREFIDTNLEDLGEVQEGIEENVADLEALVPEFEELLDDPGVSEFVKGVSGGLESTTNVVGKVKEGLDELDELVEALKVADALTSDNAQTQLDAFATAFEMITNKLGPYIDMVPGLGAFFRLYGMGIRNIAQSAGVLTEITGRRNELYQVLRPGEHLYITPDTIRSDAIRDLENERVALMDQALQTARDERLDREERELGSGTTDLDIALGTALNRATDSRPDVNSEAYQAWVAASNDLSSARTALESARAEFASTTQDAQEAAVRAETTNRTGRDSDLIDAQAASTAAAAARAQTVLDDANTRYDDALRAYGPAHAAHRAEIYVYDEAVKAELIKLAPNTNSGRGFSDNDLRMLGRDYPQWRLSPDDVRRASAPATTPLSMGAVPGAAMASAAPVMVAADSSWSMAGLGFATALITAGLGMLFVGQPFDTGVASVAVSTPVAVGVPQQTDDPATENGPDEGVPPPDYGAFDAMVDVTMHNILGVSALDGQVTPFLADASATQKGELSPVSSPLYSSFAPGPLAPETFTQGPVLPLTGAVMTTLPIDGSGATPQSIFDTYAPLVDVAFEPTAVSGSPGDMIALGFRIDADLTDPSVCGGNLLNIVANLFNPGFGDPYTANPSFPGEFYAGGNVFLNFSLVNCAPQNFADAFIGGEVSQGLADPAAAFLTVRDGVTNGVIVVAADDLHPDGNAHLIFFEHPDGENFVLENTRYQSYPDIFGPGMSFSAATNGSIDDFTLVPGRTLDQRVSVQDVQFVRDADGRLWIEVVFAAPWGSGPPNDLFSHWVQVFIEVDGAQAGVSQEWHDAVKNLFSVTADGDFAHRFFVTADGTLVIDSGLDVADQGSVLLVIDSASWTDATDTNGRASDHQELDLSSVAFPSGDPAALGGGFVFDLVAGTPLGTAAVDTGTDAAVTTTTEGDPDQTRPELVAAGLAVVAIGSGLLAGVSAVGREAATVLVDSGPPSVISDRPGKAEVAAEIPPKVGIGARVRGP